MDELSNQSGIGGDIGGHLVNNLCYVDDLCLIGLSLDLCSRPTYAIEHLLTYTGSKSYYSVLRRSILNSMLQPWP